MIDTTAESLPEISSHHEAWLLYTGGVHPDLVDAAAGSNIERLFVGIAEAGRRSEARP
jgi:hypothetical protein